MQAREYRERLEAAAEIAKDAVGATNGASANGSTGDPAAEGDKAPAAA
jgi:hypothetical protein